ncbi:MAG TPA: YciI family protein [Pirellulales bacterium]|nr:YciI family protein [Pirellulales bacterium]
MHKFMVILHSPPGTWKELPRDELEQRVAELQSWTNELRSSGRYVSGEKLMEEGGKRLTRQRGRLNVIDGPYSEAKEVVGGYFVFRAASYHEAVEMLRGSPFLDDWRVELRQTDAMGCGGE